MKRIKNLKYKIFITVMLLIYALVLYVSPISCVILELTGVECPGCGMTRALVSAMRFDFRGALSHHLMFWSVPLLYLCFLLDGKLFKNKYLNTLFYLLILAGFLVNWIF